MTTQHRSKLISSMSPTRFLKKVNKRPSFWNKIKRCRSKCINWTIKFSRSKANCRDRRNSSSKPWLTTSSWISRCTRFNKDNKTWRSPSWPWSVSWIIRNRQTASTIQSITKCHSSRLEKVSICLTSPSSATICSTQDMLVGHLMSERFQSDVTTIWVLLNLLLICRALRIVSLVLFPTISVTLMSNSRTVIHNEVHMAQA